MSRTTKPKRGIEIDLSIPCASWRRALPAVAGLTRAAAEAALAQSATGRARKKIGAAELSLVLADDATVHALNARWRGKDAPTNVLAFASDEAPDAGKPVLLGDVVLAFETVAAEAKAQGKSLADHLRHLVIHGVLHLLGYDHIAAAPAKRMEALETRILASLGVADPYRPRAPTSFEARHG
ncbi:MAG TPA: rRNA maturation RNase YbeY [Stellaceae bacterium]|nr:rRNA maturation RNase YbeY [Stellaceae bacterium]